MHGLKYMSGSVCVSVRVHEDRHVRVACAWKCVCL